MPLPRKRMLLADELDRRVDLMSDARGELPDRLELGLHELRLSRSELVEGRRQGSLPALGRVPEDQHDDDEPRGGTRCG